MKKIFTFLLAAGTITVASAQSPFQKDRAFKEREIQTRNISRNNNYESNSGSNDHGRSLFSFKEKEGQLQKIHRKFDHKIAAVKKNRRFNAREKSALVQKLQNQRRQEISLVQSRYKKANQRDTGKHFDKNNSHRW